MNSIYTWLQNNIGLAFLLYGLALIVIGVAILFWLEKGKTLSIRTRLFRIGLMMAAFFTFVAVYSLQTLNMVKVNGTMYKQIVQGKDLMADILPPPEYIIESYLTALETLGTNNVDMMNIQIEKSESLFRNYQDKHKFWKASLKEDKIKNELIETSYRPAMEFYKLAREKFIPLIKAGNKTEARNLAYGAMREKYEQHRMAIDNIVGMLGSRNSDYESRTAMIIRSRTIMMVFFSIIGLSILGIALYFIIVCLVKPVKNIVAGINEIRRGNLDYEVPMSQDNEMRELAGAFNKMTSDLRQEIKKREKSESCVVRLNDLREALMRPCGVSDKLRIITDGIVSVFDADFARIWMIRPADLCQKGCVHAKNTEGPGVCRHRDFCLHLMASSGRYTHINGDHQRVPFGCYKIGLIASGEDKKFLTNDAANNPRVHNHEWVRELGLVSFAGYRLLNSAGEVIGVMALFSKHPISSEEDELLLGLAHTSEQVIMATSAGTEVRLLNESLEKRVEERTAQLAATNEELKNFVYIASHDLREPLRKISAFGSMVQKSLSGKIDGDDAENLNFMIDGANRMTQMIEGLLAYSRVSSKANSAETVNLNDIVDQLRQLELSVLLEEKHTTIDIPQPLPEVDVDPVRIRQLLQNLIANGMKYQAKGNTPQITITSRPAADGMVRINITDNGIGIKPEFQQAIFIMFKRLHSKNEYEGTGIGLAVCKKIVERNGGQIGVESEFGKGSTFWFTLPTAGVNKAGQPAKTENELVVSTKDNNKQL
ncbi:MAG TPA: hypothetical protein DDW84_03310 [Phycisphaerales bacterium]|nr:MAG: hypothetical protein A2Y13_06945 [Planctomycetes bacterium GWC2_45_44]HBG77867.1 hypothetical protein [Phycisphaerales bacterium]HBR18656.1 hypothetical protein [Phycisphaerales bacterium]